MGPPWPLMGIVELPCSSPEFEVGEDVVEGGDSGAAGVVPSGLPFMSPSWPEDPSLPEIVDCPFPADETCSLVGGPEDC